MKKITVITGHYGSGKTNLAVNLALECSRTGEPVTVVDLDIVNPYFRTADFAELFKAHGITLAATAYANTSLDIPAVTFDLERLAFELGHLRVDVGGDDAGAAALGRYSAALNEYAPDRLDMLYVINRYRYTVDNSDEEAALLHDIEAASRMSCTGIVNNSNLGIETTAELFKNSMQYAEKISELTKLPIVFNVCRSDIEIDVPNRLSAEIYVKPIWERGN